jgi:hypothetical protein
VPQVAQHREALVAADQALRTRVEDDRVDHAELLDRALEAFVLAVARYRPRSDKARGGGWHRGRVRLRKYKRLEPSYQDCDGGNRCRNQFVATLKTDARTGAIPIDPPGV